MSFQNFQLVMAVMTATGSAAVEWERLVSEPEEAFAWLQDAHGREKLSLELECSLGPVAWGRYDAQREALDRSRARAVCCLDADYPQVFREVAHRPPIVYYRGDLALLGRRGIAVVGTRKPSPGAVALARRLGRDLSAAGVAVVSGLARGIDTAAHVGALRAPGTTVAVMGTGIDVPYPPENAELLVEIARRGCVVSEQWMGMHPERHVFPRRNRLISALAHAVVVVEGGLRSGALITARWALEQGRDVGAVPGFPGDFRSAGPNQLLRQGAFVVESAADVFDAVPRLRRLGGPGGDSGDDAPCDATAPGAAGIVLRALGSAPVHPDAIARATGLSITEILVAVVQLEVDGCVVRDEAGNICRIRT